MTIVVASLLAATTRPMPSAASGTSLEEATNNYEYNAIAHLRRVLAAQGAAILAAA